MMNDATKPTAQPAAVTPPGKLVHATPTTAPLVAGRRSFFKYRDLGVTAASSGKIRAQVTIGADGMTQPTGWHYHVCEGQFVYMLSGWVDLEFEDGQKLRIQAGESLYLPAGLQVVDANDGRAPQPEREPLAVGREARPRGIGAGVMLVPQHSSRRKVPLVYVERIVGGNEAAG